MSPRRARPDAPAVVLAWTATLLPAGRRDWGQAMQAELAGIETSAGRWRFARGCALAIVKRAGLGPLASLTVPVMIVLATVLLTVRTSYLPMHLGLIAMVSVLAMFYVAAGFLAPAATGSRLAAAVRAAGALALGWLALGIVLSFRASDGNVADRVHTGLPIFTVLITVYLLGFTALTSATLVDTWVLARGALFGVGAAVVWLMVAVARRPLPLSGWSAFAVLALAVFAAAIVSAPREVAALTALGTALIGALTIFVLAHLALAYGPASWVPSDSAALTPAARLAQSRSEAGDTYLRVILVGVIAAVTIVVLSIGGRWVDATAAPVAADAVGNRADAT